MKTTTREERKMVIKFVLILVASMILGAATSIAAAYITQDGLVEFVGLEQTIGAAVPYVFVFANLIAAAAAILLCCRAKRDIDAWNGEDESIEQTEQRLNYSMVLANLMTVVNFLLFSASIWAAEYSPLQESGGIRMLLISLVIFVLGMTWTVFISNRTVKLVQRINPEKRGNVLDTKFHKQWMESCDEAETQLIYQCGFHAYRAGTTVCMALWVLTLLAQLWAGTGLFPVLCVCIIWLAMTVSYLCASIRLERHK